MHDVYKTPCSQNLTTKMLKAEFNWGWLFFLSTEHNEIYVETKVQPDTKELKQIGLTRAVQKEMVKN